MPCYLVSFYPFTFLNHLMDKIHVQENMGQPLDVPMETGVRSASPESQPTALTQPGCSAPPSSQHRRQGTLLSFLPVPATIFDIKLRSLELEVASLFIETRFCL